MKVTSLHNMVNGFNFTRLIFHDTQYYSSIRLYNATFTNVLNSRFEEFSSLYIFLCTDTGYSIHYGKNYTFVSQIAKKAKYNILLLSDTGNINVTMGMNNSGVGLDN